MLSIPEFRRLRQEDHEFEVSMSYVPYLEITSKDKRCFFFTLTEKTVLSSDASFWMPSLTAQWVLMKEQVSL